MTNIYMLSLSVSLSFYIIFNALNKLCCTINFIRIRVTFGDTADQLERAKGIQKKKKHTNEEKGREAGLFK